MFSPFPGIAAEQKHQKHVVKKKKKVVSDLFSFGYAVKKSVLLVCVKLLFKHLCVPMRFLSLSHHTLVVLCYCSPDPHISHQLFSPLVLACSSITNTNNTSIQRQPKWNLQNSCHAPTGLHPFVFVQSHTAAHTHTHMKEDILRRRMHEMLSCILLTCLCVSKLAWECVYVLFCYYSTKVWCHCGWTAECWPGCLQVVGRSGSVTQWCTTRVSASTEEGNVVETPNQDYIKIKEVASAAVIRVVLTVILS